MQPSATKCERKDRVIRKFPMTAMGNGTRDFLSCVQCLNQLSYRSSSKHNRPRVMVTGRMYRSMGLSAVCINNSPMTFTALPFKTGVTLWHSWSRHCATSRRSRVRFPMRSLEFLIGLIFPAALWPWGRVSL